VPLYFNHGYHLLTSTTVSPLKFTKRGLHFTDNKVVGRILSAVYDRTVNESDELLAEIDQTIKCNPQLNDFLDTELEQALAETARESAALKALEHDMTTKDAELESLRRSTTGRTAQKTLTGSCISEPNKTATRPALRSYGPPDAITLGGLITPVSGRTRASSVKDDTCPEIERDLHLRSHNPEDPLDKSIPRASQKSSNRTAARGEQHTTQDPDR
jgi:hypothetical protein